MNVYYPGIHDLFHDMEDSFEEEAIGLEHSKILRGWTGKKKMLPQIIRKGNYQVFLADVYQTKSTPFIRYRHCTHSLKCTKPGLKLGNPTAGSPSIPEVGFPCQALLNPPPFEKNR